MGSARVAIMADLVLSLSFIQVGLAGTNVLDAARVRYQTALAGTTREWQEGLKQLPPKYLQLLDVSRGGMRAKSDLDGIIAIEKERILFDVSRTLPDTDEGLPPAVVDLRLKYRQQVKLLANRRNQALVNLTRDYTNELSRQVRLFVQADRIDQAVGARTELNGVVESPVYKEAVAALALAGATGAVASGPAAGTEKPVTETPKSAPLDALVMPSFRFTEGQDNYRRVEALNGFITAVYERGIRVRLSASSLPISSIQYSGNIPRYSARYSAATADYSRRARNYALEHCSAREALQVLCASLNMGYRIDAANGEIVLVDATAQDAQWTVDNTPLEWLVKDMRNQETRTRHIGRTVFASSEVADTSQGMNTITIQCANRLLLRTAKKSETASLFLDVAQKCDAAVRKNREASTSSSYYRNFVEVSVIGEIGKDVVPGSVVVDNARLLEVYVGTDYVTRDDAASRSSPRHIRRIGE